MRISTQTMNNMVSGAAGNAYDNYYKIIEKIVSNKNFTKVSENVPEAKKLIKVNDQLAKLDEYQSNINAAMNEMGLAYDVLGDVNDQVGYINSLIIQAADASTSTDSAKAIGTEIKERVATIVDLMNTKYMGNYIFAGSNVQTQAYSIDKETGEVQYNGAAKENGERLLTIAEGTTFQYNITGDTIFDKVTLYNKTKDEEGNEVVESRETDFFTEMNDLYNLLNADTLDYNAIRSKLDVMGVTVKNITNQTGNVSAKVSKLDSTASINAKTITNLTEKKAGIEEVDITKAATDLASAQNALQASYALTSTIINGRSLLDYV